MKHRNKALSILLTLVMLAGLLPWAALGARAEGGVGLINGSTDADGNVVLDPQGSATRAQIAAIIMRFCENVAK